MIARRIALFLPSLGGGGAERVMVNLARGLAEAGRSVDIVVASAKGTFLDHVPSGARIVDLRADRVSRAVLPLARYIREAQPDALLSSMSHANVIALLARRMAGSKTRLVLSEHNTLSHTRRNSQRLGDRVLPWIMKRSYGMADAIVAVSAGVADDLAELLMIPRDKIHVIYNPVVTPEFFAQADRAVEHPWFQSADRPIVVGVGRLTAQKDFHTLIRAFGIVVRHVPARLVIFGEGEERGALEGLVKALELQDVVDLPGFSSSIYAYMARASVFALSSRWEGLPTVLIEALALGVPVVATDCESGPREILCGGELGALVPVGDPDSLARAMLAILMGDRSRAAAIDTTRYTVTYATEQYLRALDA